MTPIKEGFKVIDIPKMDYKGMVYCTQCGTEFAADQLVCAMALKGFNKNYSFWYCPTWNCNGHIPNGVYFVSGSVQTEG